MKASKWIILVIALAMMGGTAGALNALNNRHVLGPAGVKVGALVLTNELGAVVATNGILVPTSVAGSPSWPMPITVAEVSGLPEDTTFGRRGFGPSPKDIRVQTTVVLMGTDHTSIHQPQYCLYGQGWTITNSERISLHINRPYAYDIPAMKLTATRQVITKEKTINWNAIYVYWFVSGDKDDPNQITADEGSRFWSSWVDTLKKGRMERWAYVSYFAPCQPGLEKTTMGQLEQLIGASVPEFQLATGKPISSLAPAEALK